MKKLLICAILVFPCFAHAGPYYELINDATQGTSSMSVSGYIGVAASSTTPKTYPILLDAVHGFIRFPDGSKATSACVSTGTIDALPIGTFIQYGSTTAPDSYLYCNGTSYSTTTYSALYAVIGYKYGGSGANFTCDFRGMFARGLDTTGTIDSEARVIGSSETFMSQGHWHYVDVGGRGNNLYWGAGGGVNQYGVGNAVTNDITKPALATTTLGDAVNGTPIMGKETRPKNIAVAVMVKYQNPVVNYNGLTSSNTWSGSNTFTAQGAGGTAISSATITSNYTTGFTQLGSTAPKIKVKKVTGTTNANQNAGASIAHGLTASKIISGVCVVWISADQYMASGYTFFAGYNFSYDVDSADIHLYNSNANSGNILSKPITCTFIYEE